MDVYVFFWLCVPKYYFRFILGLRDPFVFFIFRFNSYVYLLSILIFNPSFYGEKRFLDFSQFQFFFLVDFYFPSLPVVVSVVRWCNYIVRYYITDMSYLYSFRPDFCLYTSVYFLFRFWFPYFSREIIS